MLLICFGFFFAGRAFPEDSLPGRHEERILRIFCIPRQLYFVFCLRFVLVFRKKEKKLRNIIKMAGRTRDGTCLRLCTVNYVGPAMGRRIARPGHSVTSLVHLRRSRFSTNSASSPSGQPPLTSSSVYPPPPDSGEAAHYAPSSFPAHSSASYFHFEVLHTSKRSGARVGRIHTPHGTACRSSSAATLAH